MTIKKKIEYLKEHKVSGMSKSSMLPPRMFKYMEDVQIYVRQEKLSFELFTAFDEKCDIVISHYVKMEFKYKLKEILK